MAKLLILLAQRFVPARYRIVLWDSEGEGNYFYPEDVL